MRHILRVTLAAALLIIPARSQSLEAGFQNPPDSAKPRTWWHWTNGNVTLTGITKDLEWMKRVGIGGFQLADVAYGMGQTIDRKIFYGTPEWYDAVHHAAAEADRLGLEMSIFSSPGWSITGGPWVKPEQAMKKLVWSETTVQGPKSLHAKLAAPPAIIGPIRNLSTAKAPETGFYGDARVVAYRAPANDADPRPKVTTSAGALDAAALLDDDLNSSFTLPAGGPAWIQYEYEKPFAARAITIASRDGIPFARLLSSPDGAHFTPLVELPGAQLYRAAKVRTFALTGAPARFYRLELLGAVPKPAEVMNQTQPAPPKQYTFSEFILHAAPRVNRWEEKAVFGFMFEYDSVPTPPSAGVATSDVIDLTSKMAPDGTLDWKVPAGRWTILRLGYSLTGAKNRPPVPAGLGYEADKLSAKHMEEYFHGYFDPLAKALGPLFGRALSHILIDSWEAGMQNWTEDLPAQFQRLRGYDITPWLPVLTGRIVGSATDSDRFLWDFRRTLADLFAENHYGVLTRMAHERGLRTYSEAAGVSLEIPEDTLLNKSFVDIPMGEFWVRDLHPSLMYYMDMRGAASAAHIYGKRIVAAESFTGGGYETPETLRRIADRWFAEGLNRLVFHTSAHQPLDTKPGNRMVGTHIHRNIEWAEQAGPLMTYFARSSYMMQQGLAVADLLYLLPEGAPSTMPIWGAGLQPPVPEGHDYDFINADALLKRITVKDGRLTLPDGTSYAVLVLPQTPQMTPDVLNKIRVLVEAGATVLGPRPSSSPSLAQPTLPATDLWGDLDGVSRTTRRAGAGRVVWGLPVADVLALCNVGKDVDYGRALDQQLAWAHRRDGATEIYFISNRSAKPYENEVRFRASGEQVELWHADSSKIQPAQAAVATGHSTLTLKLGPYESVFVVFRPKARS